jgi:hypothetical protein
VWRPFQRSWNIASTSPARDWELRDNYDRILFNWAQTHPDKPVLVAGHTHRPIFGSSRKVRPPERQPNEIEADLEAERGKPKPDKDALARLRAELELVRTPSPDKPPMRIAPPCYFNTGCCSFGDGDVTALEIADGEIRLVRWPDDDDRPRLKLLADASLDEVFAKVSSGEALEANGHPGGGRAQLA